MLANAAAPAILALAPAPSMLANAAAPAILAYASHPSMLANAAAPTILASVPHPSMLATLPLHHSSCPVLPSLSLHPISPRPFTRQRHGAWAGTGAFRLLGRTAREGDLEGPGGRGLGGRCSAAQGLAPIVHEGRAEKKGGEEVQLCECMLVLEVAAAYFAGRLGGGWQTGDGWGGAMARGCSSGWWVGAKCTEDVCGMNEESHSLVKTRGRDDSHVRRSLQCSP